MKHLAIITVVLFVVGCSSSDKSTSFDPRDMSDMVEDTDAGYSELKQTCQVMAIVDTKVCEPALREFREIGSYPGSMVEQSCFLNLINPEQDCVTIVGCQEPHIRDDLISKGWIEINEFPPRCETIDPDLGIPEPDMG